MKSLKIFIPLFILLIAGLSISCGNDKNSIKVKNWEILYEQDQTLESVMQKSGWEPVSVPLKIELPYPPIKGFQYVWLKGELEITDDPADYYGLSTERVSLADKMFINYKFVGSLPPDKANWNPTPRNYVIPKGTLKKGNNIIFIQLGIYLWHGILEEVLVQSEENFNRTQLIANLLYKRLPFGMIFLYLGLIIHSLISFLWDREDKTYLYFPMILLSFVIFMFITLPSYKLVDLELYLAIKLSSVCMIFVFLILGIQSSYRTYLSNFNRIIIPLMLSVSLFSLIFSNTSYSLQIFEIFFDVYSIVIIPLLIFMIYRLNSINRLTTKNVDKISRGNIVLSLVIISFILVFTAYFIVIKGYYSGHGITFLPPFLIIIWSVTLARESMKRKLELELLYNKLKQFEGQEKEVLITESSEEKLNRVIDFIKENYTSDLSREGLAAAVEINPNYLGTLFKAYKDEKINDYINRLRIEEAKSRLDSDESRVIDIAFSVGFESIVTFNRAFKRVTGVTPSEFKS